MNTLLLETLSYAELPSSHVASDFFPSSCLAPLRLGLRFSILGSIRSPNLSEKLRLELAPLRGGAACSERSFYLTLVSGSVPHLRDLNREYGLSP